MEGRGAVSDEAGAAVGDFSDYPGQYHVLNDGQAGHVKS